MESIDSNPQFNAEDVTGPANKPQTESRDADTETFIVLGGMNGAIRKELYDAVAEQAKKRLPELIRGGAYRAQKLLGDAFWTTLDRTGNRIHAGRVLSHLVAGGALPLVVVRKKHEYPKEYELM